VRAIDRWKNVPASGCPAAGILTSNDWVMEAPDITSLVQFRGNCEFDNPGDEQLIIS